MIVSVDNLINLIELLGDNVSYFLITKYFLNDVKIGWFLSSMVQI